MLRNVVSAVLLLTAFYAEAQLYACKHAHAAEAATYGTPWPTPWPAGCVDVKLAYNPLPCERQDVAYVDEHRVLRFLHPVPNQVKRQVIKGMVDSGFIQFLDQ
jgi:hypothetical protein